MTRRRASRRRPIRALAAVVTFASAVLAVGAVGVAPADQPTVHAQTGPGAGGEFHAVSPTRVLDTRVPSLDAAPLGKKPATAAGSDFHASLYGPGGPKAAGLPASPADILAVVATVTVAEPTAPGWLAVRARGAQRKPIDKMSSLVNFDVGRNVPNLAIVGVSTSGELTFTLRTSPNGRAHVLVDVVGWISNSSAAVTGGARLQSYGPSRLIDTRNPGQQAFRDGETRTLKVRGAKTYNPTLTIPSSASVRAVLVNITAVNTRARGLPTYLAASDIKLTPPDSANTQTRVKTSNVNAAKGQIKAGLAVVPIDANGNIHVYNHDGEIDVVIDVVGYFQTGIDPATAKGRIVPLDTPFRAFDTRLAAFGNVPLGYGSVEDWSFKNFAASVSIPNSGALAQSALIGNITATDVRRVHPGWPIWSTYLTAFPGGTTRPVSSNLNLGEGEVVPNLSLLTYGAIGSDRYGIRMYNHDGSVHYVLDVYAIVLAD